MIDDNILLEVAELLCKIREESPDAETKVGAVLLTPTGYRVKATGFNHFPTDHDYPNTRPEKYPYMVHAEASIVTELGRYGCENHKMFVTHAPCNDCVKLMLKAGVSEVWYFDSHLVLSAEARKMLRNAKVKAFWVHCRAEEYKDRPGTYIEKI